jgi:PAS domain S-box-containing protein
MNKIKSYIFTLAILLSCFYSHGQFDESRKRAMFIINFAKKITWPYEDTLHRYRIGVLDNNEIYDALCELIKSDSLRGKPYQVIKIKRIKDLGKTEILYCEKVSDNTMKDILIKIRGQQTLLISNQWPNNNYVMINFLKDPVKLFEINNKNILAENLTISEKVIVQGGSDNDLRKIYRKSEQELKSEKEKVEAQREELARQMKELTKLNTEINDTKKELDLKRKEIEKQKAEIDLQRVEYDTLIRKVKEQEKKLDFNLKIVELQETEMATQQKEIETRSKVLDDLKTEISKAQETIKTKDFTLTEQDTQIKTQKGVIYIFIVFLLLVASLAYLIYRQYKIKQLVNKQLEEKNIAINLQKTEIEAQARELEKLSIVASETDNAVIITDQYGDFEWVNESFTRMFGFTLEQLVKEKSANIIGPNTLPSVKQAIHHCMTKKETVTYQFSTKTRIGGNLWVQATLTPILDKGGDIRKIIAIDSDITKVKEAELEIQQQAEELSTQAEELQKINFALHREKDHTMGSIRYGLTIQTAMLPLQSEMNKYFKTFIIYRPKDVVSGDFYWFNRVYDEDTEKEKMYVASVDCTGHGVPGAFMSMIGNRLLNEIVNNKKIFDPYKMLDALNIAIIKALKQEVSDNNDGMDICLVEIEKQDKSEYKVTYAGAKLPLFYFENGNSDLQILEGTRKSIGGAKATRNIQEFADQTIILPQGATMYLATDGFIDQNGPDRKRFSTKRLVAALMKGHSLSMEAQKNLLETEFDNYRQNQPQRDDVTLLGIKLI